MKKLLFIFGFLFFLPTLANAYTWRPAPDYLCWTFNLDDYTTLGHVFILENQTVFPYEYTFYWKIFDEDGEEKHYLSASHMSVSNYTYFTTAGVDPNSDSEVFIQPNRGLIDDNLTASTDYCACTYKGGSAFWDFDNLYYKNTNTTYTTADLVEWDGTGTPSCFASVPTCITDSSECANQTDCENANWYWNEYYDIYDNLYGECLDDDPCPTNWNDCHDQTRCENSDWFWNQWLADNVKCRETSECDIEPSGSVTYDDVLAMCSTEKSCEDQGGTWFYDSSLYFGGVCLVGPEENQLYKTKGTFINPVSLFTSYVISDDKNIKNFAYLTTKILYKPFLPQGNILPALYVDDSYNQSTCYDSYTIELEDGTDNIFADELWITYVAQRYLKEYESELTSEEELGAVYLRCRDPELEPNRSYDLDTLDDTDEFIFNSDAFLPIPVVSYIDIGKYCLAGEYLDVYILSSYCQYYGNDHDQENGGVRGQFTVEIKGDFGILLSSYIDSTCPFAFFGFDFCIGWEAVKNGGIKFFDSLVNQITEVLTKISKFFLPFREDGTQICIQIQDGFLCNTYDYANTRGLVDIAILFAVMSAFFFSLFFPKL